MTFTQHNRNLIISRSTSGQPSHQLRFQGLSSLPPFVIGTETLVAAGHVTRVSVPTTKGGREERPWERGCPHMYVDMSFMLVSPVVLAKMIGSQLSNCFPFVFQSTHPVQAVKVAAMVVGAAGIVLVSVTGIATAANKECIDPSPTASYTNWTKSYVISNGTSPCYTHKDLTLSLLSLIGGSFIWSVSSGMYDKCLGH